MRRLALFLLVLCSGPAAFAHLVVDVRMTIDAPAFAPIGQPFTYRVIADDLANDPGYGVVVTIPIPASASAPSVSADGWNCSVSSSQIRCSAEQMPPGPNAITVRLTAPPGVGSLALNANVQTIGSLDTNDKNDQATANVTLYDPQQCTAGAPMIVGPADGTSVAGIARLSWTAVAGAVRYRIYTAREGETPASAATTTATEAVLPFLPGDIEWWVEAEFDVCPPVASSHQHFRSTTNGVAFRLFEFAGRSDRDATIDGSIDAAGFRTPYGLALAAEGDLYVSDAQDDVLRHIVNGRVVTITGTPGVGGSADGQHALFYQPHGITITPLDGWVHIADTSNDSIRIIYTGGPFAPAFTTGGAAGQPGYVDGDGDKSRYRGPMAIAASERGTLYVADSGNQVIRKMTQVPGFVGAFTASTLATGFNSPQAIAVGGDGTVYIADNHSIRRIDHAGVVTTVTDALNAPTGIAVDNRGNLYVSDSGDQTIRKIAPSGLVTAIASGFNGPAGIAVDASGTIYVADSRNHRVVLLRAEAAAGAPRKRAAAH